MGVPEEIRVGARVRVLPGRQFPAFSAGDAGEVRRLDHEARTCDVLFDRGNGVAVPVAVRHLSIEDPGTAIGLGSTSRIGGSGLSASSSTGNLRRHLQQHHQHTHQHHQHQQHQQHQHQHQHHHHSQQHQHHSPYHSHSGTPARSSKADAEQHAESWQRQLRVDLLALQERLVAFEEQRGDADRRQGEWLSARVDSAINDAISQGRIRPELARDHETIKQRLEPAISVLEGRVLKLENAVYDQAGLHSGWPGGHSVQEDGGLHRKRRASHPDVNLAAEEGERRTSELRDVTWKLREELERIAGELHSQERRAKGLEEVVGSSGAGLTRLASLLEGKERRTSELGQAINRVDDGVSRLAQLIDKQAQVLADLQRQAEGLGAGANGTKTQDREPIWQALRELQELVVHESENRAAGLREVLSVLGQGVEQLRGEQSRVASDLEGRSRSEHRRVKQRLSDVQAKHSEHEKRAETLDQRMEVLAQALAAERAARAEAVAAMEDQVREVKGLPLLPRGGSVRAASETAVSRHASPAGGGGAFVSGGLSAGREASLAPLLTPSSLQRLEAMEARFGVASSPMSTPTLNAPFTGQSSSTYVPLSAQPTHAVCIGDGAMVGASAPQVVRCASAPTLHRVVGGSCLVANGATRPLSPGRVTPPGQMLSPGRQTPVSEFGRPATVCSCGTTFAEDAVFCRRCGQRRCQTFGGIGEAVPGIAAPVTATFLNPADGSMPVGTAPSAAYEPVAAPSLSQELVAPPTFLTSSCPGSVTSVVREPDADAYWQAAAYEGLLSAEMGSTRVAYEQRSGEQAPLSPTLQLHAPRIAGPPVTFAPPTLQTAM
eukprot:TRINITY_DN34897_c0_g1_i1.p1 TRINITY_DN34897_c0_g1~~TRINITY_DN34897_c0_g1_i1.p1  ORF type:complete len:833 (-),score=156.06 TRINITY_DN34897_c0_g1_i1:233-2731(-)